jgi:hypothetical protein
MIGPDETLLQAAGASECSAAARAAAAGVLAGGPGGAARLQGHPVRAQGPAAKTLPLAVMLTSSCYWLMSS